LIERQVLLLRGKNHKLEDKLGELVQVGRDNERLANRMQSLAIGLLEADSLDAVLATTSELLRHEFDAEQVVIRLIDHECDDRTQRFPERFISQNAPELALFNDFFANKRPMCGRLSPRQLDFLFGTHKDTVASAALVPLTAGRELGLLALSSCSPRRFQPHMGLLFLTHLSELVSNALKPHLSAPSV
jgi:uncharacterized protein YigA (DUF484 family)